MTLLDILAAYLAASVLFAPVVVAFIWCGERGETLASAARAQGLDLKASVHGEAGK